MNKVDKEKTVTGGWGWGWLLFSLVNSSHT